jgi:hypothetical protein
MEETACDRTARKRFAVLSEDSAGKEAEVCDLKEEKHAKASNLVWKAYG